MPLMKFHLVKGRSTEEIDRLLDVAHRAMVSSFKVPEGDRYQILTEHEPSHLPHVLQRMMRLMRRTY